MSMVVTRRKASLYKDQKQDKSKSRQRSQSQTKVKTNQSVLQSTCNSSRKKSKPKKKNLNQSITRKKKSVRRDSTDMNATSIRNQFDTQQRKRERSRGHSSDDSLMMEQSPQESDITGKRHGNKGKRQQDEEKYERREQHIDYFIEDTYDQDQDPLQSQQESETRNFGSRQGQKGHKQSRQSERSQQFEFQEERSTTTTATENFFEKEYKETQKELLHTKSKIYEYRYKVDSLKNKLIEIDKERQEVSGKLQLEQIKSDEYCNKAEKYKAIAKEYKNEIKSLNNDLNSIIAQREEDTNYYEEAMKTIQNRDQILARDHINGIKEIVSQLNIIQKTCHQLGQPQIFANPINGIFDSIRKLNALVSVNNQNECSQSSLSDQTQDPKKYFIGDKGSKYKVSKDSIIFNGESLGGEDNLCIDLGSADFSQTITPNKQGFYESSKADEQYKNQSQDSDLQLNIIKIQQDMLKIKEESSKVFEENNKLVHRNNMLTDELHQEKFREQSLIPQYKEAFDQMRLANEMMANKIDELEKERMQTTQVISQKFDDDLKEMKYRMHKFEYENKNLKDEKEMLVNQISNLDTYNKTQEKMISHFQNTYSSIIQNMQLQQQQNMTQPMPQVFSLNSTKQLSQGVQDSLDLNTFMVKSQQKSSATSSQQSVANNQYHRSKGSMNQQYDLHNQHQAEIMIQQYNQQQNRQNQAPQQQNIVVCNQDQPLRKQTSNSVYIETSNFDNNKSCENEHLFSLSSTQPENYMKLMSPMNQNVIQPKHLDFGRQVMTAISNKDLLCSSAIDQNYQQLMNEAKVYPQTTTNQNHKQGMIDNQIMEETKSSEMTKRVKTPRQDYNQMLIHLKQSLYLEDGQQSVESKESFRSEHLAKITNSESSGENISQQMQSTNRRSGIEMHNQDTFQQQNENQQQLSTSQRLASSQRQLNNNNNGGIKSNRNQLINRQEQEQQQQPVFSEDALSQSFNCISQTSYEVRSPTFQDQNNSDSNNFGMDITNEIQNKQKTKASPFVKLQIPKDSQSLVQGEGASLSSANFMSERTINLKKEITSLDEEIYMLQNSLKHALQKKTDDQ